jgi:hypothetical protein
MVMKTDEKEKIFYLSAVSLSGTLMKDTRKLFHYISYLQYPLMLVGLFFCYKPFISDINSLWVEFNRAMVFMGLGISMSTLQDTAKTQNTFIEAYLSKSQVCTFVSHDDLPSGGVL